MNVVVAGDYQGKAVVFIDGTKGIGIATKLLKRNEWVPLTKETIEKYEVVLDEPMKPAASRTFRLSVEFHDGKKSLIELDEKFYKILMNKTY